MSGPINRIAPGFLSFFGIKSNGVNPEYIADQIALTIDMVDWFMNDNVNLETLKGTVSINAVGSSLGDPVLVVPQTEAWLVANYTSDTAAALGAGQALQYVLSMAYPATTSSQPEVLGPPSNLGTTGDFVFAARSLPCKPFFVGPGGSLTVNALRLTAGPVSAQQFIRFARMRL